jgi:hypothetical protein
MVSDFNIAPSEVRSMTMGEINAIIWAKTRGQHQNVSDIDELYQDFKRLKDE